MTLSLRRLLIGFGALAVLAGCASNPYRTGHYYPATDGHGDYYTEPARRPYYGPYYGPYYYGFYHYPYHHGFYGHFHHGFYGFHHLGYGFGGHPDHGFYRLGFGYGFDDPHYGGHFGPHRFHPAPDHHSDRHFRRGDDRDPRSIRLRNRPGDAEHHPPRTPPAKNDPDLRYPQRQRAAVPGPAVAPQPMLTAVQAELAMERERRIEPYRHRSPTPAAAPRLVRTQSPAPPPVGLVNRPQQAPVRIATPAASGKSHRKGSPLPAPVRAPVAERRVWPSLVAMPARTPAAPAAVTGGSIRPASAISRPMPASPPPRAATTRAAPGHRGGGEPIRPSETDDR